MIFAHNDTGYTGKNICKIICNNNCFSKLEVFGNEPTKITTLICVTGSYWLESRFAFWRIMLNFSFSFYGLSNSVSYYSTSWHLAKCFVILTNRIQRSIPITNACDSQLVLMLIAVLHEGIYGLLILSLVLGSKKSIKWMNGINLKIHFFFFPGKACFYWYNACVLFHFRTNSITEYFKF